jgi:hypothetical protein
MSRAATWRAWSTRSVRGSAGVAAGDEVFGLAVRGGWAEYAVVEHFAVKPGRDELGGGGSVARRGRDLGARAEHSASPVMAQCRR